MRRKLIYYFNLCIHICYLIVLVNSVANEIRCGSVDIRNTPKMAFQPRSSNYKSQNDALKYRDCTIIDGDITISMITDGNHTHDDYPVFENLREITGSILVFNIKGLMSLGKLFPNLRVIGGNSLIMNYALVIYQNPDLRHVNLTQLTTIKNGGVRITENAKLCYAKDINWEKIMAGKIRDYIVDQVAGRCESVCAVEDESACERDTNGKTICWSPTTCQRTCKIPTDSSGCTDAGEPCHPLCKGGCFEPNNVAACFTCRHFDVEGVCVEKCPPNMFAMLKRRCLTREQCVDLFPVIGTHNREERKMWKPFQGTCHYECPRDYQPDPYDAHNCVKCEGYCPKVCAGDIVDSVGSAMKFSKCNVVDGNLEVDMRVGMETTSGEKFTEAFGEIEEITGYLLIRFSTAFMSLHMFKRLRIIHGETLWKNMYALVVFENPNLRQLFYHSGMEILRGKVSFQNNRMLCYKTIAAFVDSAVMYENISESDVSAFSNGDKAICDEIPLEAKIVSVYSYGFILTWTPFNTTDMDHRKFLGYQIFYKHVDKEDYKMSIDDDRSACSDSWNMVFVTEGLSASELPIGDGTPMTNGSANENSIRGELVNQGIEANKLYAVYMQTRLVNHPGAKNAISKILFVRTPFTVPDPPRTITAVALDANTLKIQWELPLNSYGVITHYTFSWMLDKPQLPTNETLLCTMRLQKSRKENKLMPKDAAVLSDGTCPREQGCCKCEDVSKKRGSVLLSHSTSSTERSHDANSRSLEAEQEERAMFENTVQNAVFVQKPRVASPRKPNSNALANSSGSSSTSLPDKSESRKRRSLQDVEVSDLMSSSKNSDALNTLNLNDTESKEGSMPFLKQLISNFDQVDDIRLLDPFSPDVERKLEVLRKSHPESTVFYVGRFEDANAFEMGKIDVKTMSVILTGLPHYSEYQINVNACQDETAVEHYCSSRPAWISIKTMPIMNYDQVLPETVMLVNVTGGKPTDRKIYWDAPKRPNGLILTYRVKLFRDDESTPLEQCIPVALFENNNGILFSGLPSGRYSIEIRVETSTEMLGNATIIENLFEIASPTFFTPLNILIMVVVFLLILLISTALCFRYATHQVEGKMGEIVTQNISNNPDYLSQYNFYTADDWELNREDVILKQNIGKGTFGLVFCGEGRGVLSNCGVRFGPCAVKTIADNLQSQERFLFLCEANVMKKFNTEFIVKLYGVVSNGTPVLVVMELMEKGNLRDFLRSLRPGAEENVNNRPPPTLIQYFTWAAQIADGMAYLEDQQFCHRDLAARNCMVHANESVKIGDFGMTRDLYYQEYYKPAGKRMMPVRWMSPEALKDGTFSTRSDVWSYGIVLYEMLTLGEQPYAGLGNDEVFHMVVFEHRIPKKPAKCHPFWYSLMRSCWQRDSRRRPLFQQIVNYLKPHATEEFKQLSYVVNHLKPERICKEKYNFNQKYDEGDSHYHHSNKNNNEDGNRDEQLYATTARNAYSDKEDEFCREKRSRQSGVDKTASWDDKDWPGEVDENNAKLSIAGRAIKKARELGAPFMGRRRQNRLYNYKVDKWTVLATLLGFNPKFGKRRQNDNEVVNEAYGIAPITPLTTNEYTKEARINDTRIEMEKEDGEENDELDEEEEASEEEDEESDMDEDEDEEQSEQDEEDEFIEKEKDCEDDVNKKVQNEEPSKLVQKTAQQKAMMLKNLKQMANNQQSQQCDYIETDPNLHGADEASLRPSSSGSSASYVLRPSKKLL